MELPIRKRRKDLHISVEQAAVKAGITVSMWYKIESGERTPSLQNARDIARVLNWTPNDFFVALDSTQSANDRRRSAAKEVV